ncbi:MULTISPECIES: hypothetical protein [unclassified Rhizobium]|uniref:hypothetical protein n=1 Tax=unclassified Rhizobium TaxID=2613769 RepID=UPI001A98BB32|nr:MULTISPECIES: hypothetical protein [unclassified Rhizobium]MBX5162254.1 hypothetical protein [Rhizobium sp. NZLR4b]MBX5200767.1 hypothetical protein [Rhizobium sp. NZLR1]MBX5206475.1 hypothetical protein [Rhizobium sp. NZLR11]QSZ21792.1 hypothetical protein J3O30_04265 [Rhizobium sp. NZLR1]
MTNYFCTLFDSGYLIKGMAMMESLVQWCPDAHVFVLCMDQKAQEILIASNRSYITCIPLADLETPELLEAKKSRGVAEYCWTLSPCLPTFVLDHYPEINFITYLDSDLLFYSPIRPILEEIGDSSIAIIEHRFAPRLQDREVNGRFCVEWVSFRRDEEGMRCLARWREQCIEWCYYRLEDGKMGDQKYLDEWPILYPKCHIIAHPGAGIAPWNYEKLHFAEQTLGGVLVEGMPLIFYHFHQFQLLAGGGFDRLSSFYTSVCREPEAVYAAYEAALMRTLSEIRTISPGFSGGLREAAAVARRRWAQRYIPFAVKRALHRLLRY